MSWQWCDQVGSIKAHRNFGISLRLTVYVTVSCTVNLLKWISWCWHWLMLLDLVAKVKTFAICWNDIFSSLMCSSTTGVFQYHDPIKKYACEALGLVGESWSNVPNLDPTCPRHRPSVYAAGWALLWKNLELRRAEGSWGKVNQEWAAMKGLRLNFDEAPFRFRFIWAKPLEPLAFKSLVPSSNGIGGH